MGKDSFAPGEYCVVKGVTGEHKHATASGAE